MTAKLTMSKILIAEDERPLREILVKHLSDAGFEVQGVADGKAAIEAMREASFDLLLCDIKMPEMDGFEVLAKMKEEEIMVDTIMTTNLNQPSDESRCMELGAKLYLVKSNISIEEIVEIARNQTGKNGSHAS